MTAIPHSRPTFGAEEEEAVARVLRSGHVAQGPEVAAFEAECAAHVGRRYAVAASSGTAALHLTLEALLAAREPVAMPTYGCAALMTAVHGARAVAVLADVDESFQVVHATAPADATISIVPHLFGGVAPLPDAGVFVEDIAQSLGGPTGKAGIAAVASFYATKLITTGEGGMVLTDDESLAEYVRDRRDYDNRDDYARRFSYKMTDLQGAIGRVQLGRLPGFLACRREGANAYTDALREFPLRLPESTGHIFFRYVVASGARDALERHLNQAGIEAKRPVYRPAHHYLADNETPYPAVLADNYPGADDAHQTALSLPLNPAMSHADIQAVIDCIRRFFE